MSTVTLEPMRWWHIPDVAALEAELFDDPWSAELFWSELARPAGERCYLVAMDGTAAADAQLRGYAGLAVSEDESYVQTLAVAPAVQRHGLGAELLLALMTAARLAGSDAVSLEVRVDNEPAKALYRRFGFAPIGLRRGYYQPSGADALVMVADEVSGEEYAQRLAAIAIDTSSRDGASA